MLQLVNVGHKSLADYATIATRGLMDEIRRLAEPLAGKRVVHLSATAFGGGVAEINYTLIPMMQDAGLHTEWRIITPGLSLAYLLLHIWLVARACARPTPARLLASGAGLGLLFYVYFYYWTAALPDASQAGDRPALRASEANAMLS